MNAGRHIVQQGSGASVGDGAGAMPQLSHGICTFRQICATHKPRSCTEFAHTSCSDRCIASYITLLTADAKHSLCLSWLCE